MSLADHDQLEPPPFEAREREIHRLLSLMGGAPAAQYADAIRILHGNPKLQTRSLLIAHMAREIESAVRQLLGSLISVETWDNLKAIRRPEGQRDPSLSEVIAAICTALGFGEQDPIRAQWRKYGAWHGSAHRSALLADRPADDDLIEDWEGLGKVLLVLLGAYEGSFMSFWPMIDELAAADPVTTDHATKLLGGVPNVAPTLNRFYERATPAWFFTLRRKRYFRSPPRLQPNPDGYFTYEQWPPGRYLVRLAPMPDYQQAVVNVLVALDTDNPQAAETVADVALAVPVAEAGPLADKIVELLQSRIQWGLPSKAVELLPVLVAGGQLERAAALLNVLLPQPQRRRGGGGYLDRARVAPLFPALGVSGVAAIAAQLADKTGDIKDDLTLSRIWWPSIFSDQGLGSRDELVRMLRDAAESVAREAGPAEVVGALEAHPEGIFRRLTLHVLALVPEPALITARLTAADVFHDRDCFVEYGTLLRGHFGSLPPDDCSLILSLVDQGPRREDDPPGVRRWKLRQLTRFGDVLPESRQQERAELVREFGELDIDNPVMEFLARPDNREAATATLVPLDAMTDDDVITYLAGWTPTGKWEDADASDLRRLIEATAQNDPSRFCALAPRFAELDPTYARGLLQGLRKALNTSQDQNDRTTAILNWQPVLTLGEAATTQPRYLAGRPEHGDGDLDPGWSWTRRELAELLADGLQGDLPSPLLGKAFELIEQLLDDPDATASEAGTGIYNSPYVTAVNSVRGNALLALLNYAIRRHNVTTGPLDPAAGRLLDKHLDPALDPSPAIRSLYGRKIDLLVRLDEPWTRQRITQIFPHTTSPGIASAAWNAYLQFATPTVLTAHLLAPLYEQHAAAIAQAPTPETDSGEPGEDKPEDRLLQHLAVFYRHGTVSLDNGPLAHIFDHAPVHLRARIIEIIGLQLQGPDRLEQGQADRLKALCEARFEAARRPGGDLAEITWFGSWFSSGKLPEEWALAQLNEALAAGAVLSPGTDIADRLAETSTESLPNVVAAMARLVDAPDEDWFISGSRDAIATVLGNGQQSDDAHTRELAAKTISRLVARGYTNFAPR